ncbi:MULTISPECIES: SDR family NAD(P)-dependent oxidoreductase [Pseudonocardia]|uniref:3-alpha-(Or 20-beta)-hydroxysteroid dehydrogenase n=2 Tax=Pseudonocardia TaxID=1847 RepID=A0A1Y2MP09_PSEAH|nr:MULTISPECIES: SDR family oxidoreductase [Pseudonocardia]OSY36974.1 3-alpha-(or 20-beta)-hydroxysteroid dehydrogenase [Pseudonocardia autotrophica]TDN75657.1 3alpha(or 20beta)-hydroxysteroid dehydrogenase [Pseudonocardia autotrophica]BBF99629.1 oxidoreductase [Pseudonocardia autotrophica]GEC27691.1 oxidoreductase [Pseudonocardia saturnea]
MTDAISDLTGDVAVVTGGSRGIGAAVVTTLAGAGASVVVAGGSAEHGHALVDELGPAHRYLPHDVSSEQSWDALTAHVRAELGEITVLVNNAGILDPGSDISGTSVDNFDRHYRVNQLGVFLGMRAVAGAMKRAGTGSIVNLSSIGGHRGYANQIGYSTTKWAVRGMTKCAAVELGPHGVRVNSVAPGFIGTTMIDVLPGEQIDTVTAATPLGRRGTAGEIARAVLFLAARGCPFMTGAELIVDGGLAL